MVEDYRIIIRTGRAEPTGQYEVNRKGNRKPVLKYTETIRNTGRHFPTGRMENESTRSNQRKWRAGAFGKGQGILQKSLCMVAERKQTGRTRH